MSNESPPELLTVLFVCLGNICRSPTAQGILEHLAKIHHVSDYVYTESCGLGSWHTGALPDRRAREAAHARGYELKSRARTFVSTDYSRFRYILVADEQILHALQQQSQEVQHTKKLALMTHFSHTFRDEPIPDPYQGGEEGFAHVLDILEESCFSLLQHHFPHIKSA